MATPLILDLTILTELLSRIKYRKASEGAEFKPLYPVLSLLSYMLKAPLVKPGTFRFSFIVASAKEIVRNGSHQLSQPSTQRSRRVP